MARCVAVLGAPGTGKSSLVDRFCRLEGHAPPGEAVSSGDPRIAAFGWLGEPWYAIDCPGSIEFLQVGINALAAADAAIICVSPDPDAAVLAAPYLRAVEASGTPALLFINRIDEARGRIRDIVASLQDYAGQVICLRQVPIREGERVVGAVDLISERAWRYREGEPSALVAIPPELADREHEARAELLEHLADFDDWLLEQIVEDKEPDGGPVFGIAARVLSENRVIPCLFGSALHSNGVVRLMKALRHEAPPVEVLASRLAAESGVAEPLLAAAFLVRHRRHVGRTVWLRTFAAGLVNGSRLGGGTIGTLLDAGSDRAGTIGEIPAGGLAAAVKTDHLMACGLFSRDAILPPSGWSRPLPGQISCVLAPANERDDVKLSTALARLAEDDRALTVTQDAEAGGQRVDAQGPLHLRTTRETLATVFGVETAEHAVSPVYRETITRRVDKHYRHRKQTGGAGQFADVKLTVEPTPRGAGFVFDEVVKGGTVPRNYIPAVEAGARDAMAKGPLGFSVVDVHVTLIDGQHHAVDSSDMAFRIAARSGVAEALAEAVPVLLQPIHEVRFRIPSVFSGALVPVISSLKGQVLGFDRDPDAKGWDVFRALLPGGILGDLAGQLRSVTQGVGSFETTFDHFQEIYGKEAAKISEARTEKRAAN